MNRIDDRHGAPTPAFARLARPAARGAAAAGPWAGVLFATLAAEAAFAAAGSPGANGAGGLASEVTNLMETIRQAIYAVVSVLGTIALLWVTAQGFMGRKTWADVFESALWIFGAGGAVILATWIFSAGGKITL